MFDFFRRHTRVLQFILVLLVFPSFVFFGIQGYSRSGGADGETIAKVAGTSISRAQLDASLRERVEQARRQMPTLDAKLFETPEMRGLALDSLVRDRVLIAAADKLHLATTDERLDRLFKADPQFQQLRNADGSLNKDIVASLGFSSEGFAARLRDDYSRKQVMQGVAESALAPAASASAALDALYQQREVQVQRFSAKDFLAKAAPTDAQVEAFYKDSANAARFTAPEEATIEYVVLDLESLKKGLAVDEEEVRKYYTENLEKRYTTPEERKVSQILVAADKDAPKADRDKARAKADTLLAEVQREPARFAEIAKKNSDDDSTAPNGGQMEFFGRGSLLDLKPFEDAAFALKPAGVSGVVSTNFGFHILKLDAVRGGEKKTLEAVRPQIEAEQRNLLAQKRFSDAAVQFGETVFEQSDTLKPVADRWKLEIRKAEHVTRAPAAGASGALGNAKFLESVFASDALREKRNSKAVDIGANQLASARVVQSVPARLRPLADVKEQIRGELAALQATALAKKAGSERLAAVKAEPSAALSDATQIVSRAQPRDLPRPLLDAVLKANAQTLPVLVGVDLGAEGYAIAKITKLWGRDPGAAAGEANAQYARIWGDAEAQAYYAALKSRLGVTIDAKATAAPSSDEAASSAPR